MLGHAIVKYLMGCLLATEAGELKYRKKTGPIIKSGRSNMRHHRVCYPILEIIPHSKLLKNWWFSALRCNSEIPMQFILNRFHFWTNVSLLGIAKTQWISLDGHRHTQHKKCQNADHWWRWYLIHFENVYPKSKKIRSRIFIKNVSTSGPTWLCIFQIGLKPKLIDKIQNEKRSKKNWNHIAAISFVHLAVTKFHRNVFASKWIRAHHFIFSNSFAVQNCLEEIVKNQLSECFNESDDVEQKKTVKKNWKWKNLLLAHAFCII